MKKSTTTVCADCGCLSNYKGNSKVTCYAFGETEHGRFKIGFPLCDDCFIQTCKNFAEDCEEGKPFRRFQRY
jgi:hypothetical protein